MYIRKLSFRNVGPYGNVLHTLDFDQGDGVGELLQVLGKNGVGKSFFLKIIKLGLYLETDGMLISEVSNDINGDGYISIVYDSNGNTWKNESIYSASKLKTLKIYKNGSEEPEDFGGNQDTKKMLVEHILDMPYYIFNNAISLSVNDFKSFLSMDAKDTRNIRDRIFGFFIVNEMVEIIRKTLNKHIKQQEEILTSLKNLTESINTSNAQYEEAKKKNEKADTDALKTLNEKLLAYQTKYNDVKEKLDKEKAKVDDWNLIIEFLEDKNNKLELEALQNKEKQLSQSITDTENDVVNTENEAELLISEKKILVLKETKNRVNDIQKEIEAVKKKLANLKEKEELAKQSMDEMDVSITGMQISNENHKSSSDIVSNVNTLYSLQIIYKEYVDKKAELEETGKSISNNMDNIESEIKEHTDEIKKLEERQKLIESGKCDKCQTDLTTNNFIEEKSQIIEKIAEIGRTVAQKEELYEEISNSEKQNALSIEDTNNLMLSSQKSVTDMISTIMMSIPEQHNIRMSSIREYVIAINKDTIVDVAKLVKLVEEADFIEYNDKKLDEAQAKYDKLKLEYEAASEEYTTTNNDIITKQSTIKTLNEQLEGVKEEELKKELKFSDETKYEEEITTTNKKVKTKNEILTNLNKEHATVETEIKNIKIKSEDYFENLNKEYLAEYDDTPDIDTTISDISVKLGKINEDIDKLNTELNEHNTNIISTNTSINNINKQNTDNQLESIKKIIDDFQLKYDKHQEDNKELQKKVNFIKVLEYVLSDECVKAYMLREIVPTINNEIANMLMALGVNLTVIFNDEFKPTIYRFGNKASLGSISTGQKKMIDESILMSITILILMRYGKFNLVSYDEIFSSLHVTMIPIMLELIKEKLCKKLKLNVILINHSYMSSSYFDKIVHIYYKDNFSFMDIMKPDEYEMMEISNDEASEKHD